MPPGRQRSPRPCWPHPLPRGRRTPRPTPPRSRPWKPRCARSPPRAVRSAASSRHSRAQLAERDSAAAEAGKVLAARDAKIAALTADLAAATADVAAKTEAQRTLTEQAEAVAASAAALELRVTEAEAALAERNAVLERQRAEAAGRAQRPGLGRGAARRQGQGGRGPGDRRPRAGRRRRGGRQAAGRARRPARRAARASSWPRATTWASAEARLAGKDKEVAALATAGRELVVAGEEASKRWPSATRSSASCAAQLLAARNDLASAEARLASRDKEVAAWPRPGASWSPAANSWRRPTGARAAAGRPDRPRRAFLASLQQTFGPETGVRIVDDRFIFPSDVAFVSGSARLTPAARDKALALGREIAAATAALPADGDWLLRVDGHTDRQRVGGRLFASNRALSAARALEVVEVLSEAGVPPERLAPAAFGEFRPLDPADTPGGLSGQPPDRAAARRGLSLDLQQRHRRRSTGGILAGPGFRRVATRLLLCPRPRDPDTALDHLRRQDLRREASRRHTGQHPGARLHFTDLVHAGLTGTKHEGGNNDGSRKRRWSWR